MNEFTPSNDNLRDARGGIMSDRDDLADLIEATWWAIPRPEDYIWKKLADSILAAGFRPPARVIETVEELEALVDETVIRDKDGDVFEAIQDPDLRVDLWLGDKAVMSSAVSLPATVLWEPGDDDE